MTRSVDHIRRAAQVAPRYYGRTLAAEFGPLALIAVQQKLLDRDLSRGYINSVVRLIRRMFKWAVSR
jgi:hypothetical protein